MISDKIRILFLFNAIFLTAVSTYCLISGIPFAQSTLIFMLSFALIYGLAILVTLIGPLAWIGKAAMLLVMIGWMNVNSVILQDTRAYGGLNRFDSFFLKLDSFTGYSWEASSVFVSHYPLLGDILFFVYTTSIPQILILFTLLILFRRQHDAAHMVASNGLSLMLCIIVWSIIPNSGPSSYVQLPEGVEEKARIVVGEVYGGRMTDIATHGLKSIDLDTLLGMVSFPSYHTVLTCMILYFAYRLRPLFWLLVPVHIMTIPAILVTGAHLVIDVFAGVAVFFVAIKLANLLFCVKLPEHFSRLIPGPLTPIRADGQSIFTRRAVH